MLQVILDITSIIRHYNPYFQKLLVFIGIMIGAVIYRIWNFNDLSSLPKLNKMEFLKYMSAVVITFVVYDIITRFSYIKQLNVKIGNLGFSIGLGIISETLTKYIMSNEIQINLVKWLISILSRLDPSTKNTDSDKEDSKGGKDE